MLHTVREFHGISYTNMQMLSVNPTAIVVAAVVE